MNRNLSQQEFPERLFDPGPKTHEPGDWYHFSRTNEEWDPERKGRVHVGTPQAAMDRAWSTGSGPGPVHKFRLRAPMENTPETPLSEQDQSAVGAYYPERSVYYQNDVEDPGSISAGVGGPGNLELIGSATYSPRRIKRDGDEVREVSTQNPAYAGDTDRFRSRTLGKRQRVEQEELPGMPDKPSPFDAMKGWR